LIFYQSKNLNTCIDYKMDEMSGSSGFDSASYSQEYGSDVKKMGGRRKIRITRHRRERGGQRLSSRAGGKKCTKRRGGKRCRTGRKYKK
jgi:hypothetical protein